MFIAYRPEGQPEQRFDFKPGRVKLSEQARVERDYKRLSGEPRSFLNFVEDVRAGHAVALRLALHMCLRRVHPTIRLDDVDPYGDEVDVLFHRAELEELRANVEKMDSFPDKDTYLARLAVEIANAADDDGEPGKATGGTSYTSTGNSAPSRRRGRSTS